MAEQRVSERLNRRLVRSGGRRITDQYADVAHGLLCDSCDVGVAVIAGSQLHGGDLMLTYRCPACGRARDVSTHVPVALRPA